MAKNIMGKAGIAAMRVGIKTIKKNAFLYDIYTVAKWRLPLLREYMLTVMLDMFYM
jgi:hypothetical protein